MAKAFVAMAWDIDVGWVDAHRESKDGNDVDALEQVSRLLI